MGSASELADRLAVADVLVRYGSCLDEDDWERLQSCFVPDAVGLLAGGPPLEGYEAIADAVKTALAHYSATQHHIAGAEVEVDGDRASLRANLIATHVHESGAFVVKGVYREKLLRTPAGWRIVHHQLDVLWMGSA